VSQPEHQSVGSQFETAADSIRFMNPEDFIDLPAFPASSFLLTVG
jgi:hypothetical protein